VPVHATNIWKEGLQIPPLKLEERSVVRRDVLSLYLENLRYREFCHGDLMSQVGSVKLAKRRLIELLDVWGRPVIEQFSREIIDYADRRTTAEIATWPDGTYTSESWVDSDGTGMENIAIRCKLTIKGSDVIIDFSGSDPQARGGVNASEAVCQNAATTPVVLCLDPDLPHNYGCLRHIQVTAPKGTITADCTIVPADSISDAVWKCLAQAIPDKAVAGYGHIAPNAVSSGYDRRVAGRVTPWTAIFFNASSGGGACLEHDGWPLMYSPGTVGSLSFVPIEILELHYPVVARCHELRIDSMGAGRTRGGPGLTFHVEPRGTGQIDQYPYGDGMANPPFGLFGGRPGGGGALYRIEQDGSRTFYSMIGYFRVKADESWVQLSTGGGGYGDPFERQPDRVALDVKNGLVSVECAISQYGVAVDPETGEVDLTRTQSLRAKGSGRTSIVIDPTGRQIRIQSSTPG
jgi:N-methylhydantoinase B